MKNIHLLPTDKPSRLYKSKITQNIFICNIISQYGDATYNQHIYITSDEEIKEGDWCLDENENIVKADKDFIFNCSHEFDEYWKKIILTTDQDLIKDGVQAIDDEFLEWFCKNPSCESVEVDCWTIRTKDKVVYEPPLKEYEIIIPSEAKSIDCGNKNCQGGVINGLNPRLCKKCNPQEKPKQETLEEAAINFYREFPSNPLDKPEWHYNRDVDCFKKRKAFINGAKYMAERMYSEEDMMKAVRFGELYKSESSKSLFEKRGTIPTEVLKKWFENFKKK